MRRLRKKTRRGGVHTHVRVVSVLEVLTETIQGGTKNREHEFPIKNQHYTIPCLYCFSTCSLLLFQLLTQPLVKTLIHTHSSFRGGRSKRGCDH